MVGPKCLAEPGPGSGGEVQSIDESRFISAHMKLANRRSNSPSADTVVVAALLALFMNHGSVLSLNS